MTAAYQLDPAPAAERAQLLRTVESAPAPEATPGLDPPWRSPQLAGLPQPPHPPPVRLSRPPAARRRTRALPTEAQARGLVAVTARAVLEVLDGRRPAQQLDSLLSERASAAVRTMLRGGLRWPVRRPVLCSLHLHHPSPRAIEACVVFRSERRHRALALRLDRGRQRWLATAVRVA